MRAVRTGRCLLGLHLELWPMIVLLILDNQFPGAGAGDDAGSAAQIPVPGAQPIGFRAAAVVPEVLEAAHQKFRLALGALDNHDALLPHQICKYTEQLE